MLACGAYSRPGTLPEEHGCSLAAVDDQHALARSAAGAVMALHNVLQLLNLDDLARQRGPLWLCGALRVLLPQSLLRGRPRLQGLLQRTATLPRLHY